MDVYLVPVGGDRYELYCEAVPESPAARAPATGGMWRWIVEQYRAVLAAIDREELRQQHRFVERGDPPGLGVRVKRRVLRWLAERIAGQRLLWRLRQVDRAVALYPADLERAPALVRILKMLGRDRDRHRVWLVVNAAAFVGSGLLMPVPGPNLIAYYFAFRLVGHFLSMRGAGKGVSGIEWDLQPCDGLVALRQAAALEPDARDARVRDIAATLGLHGLPRFYLRIAASGA